MEINTGIPAAQRTAIAGPGPSACRYGREYSKLARVQETEGVPRAEEMMKLLIEGQEAIVRTAREVLAVADEANDQPTLDLKK